MRKLICALCVLTMMLSAASPVAFAVEDGNLQAAENAGITVLQADASDLTIECDTTIDLNGYDIDGVTVAEGATLYVRDSRTDDYTVADGIYGRVTGVTGNVEAADGYLQTGESFHAVNLEIYAMTLRASEVGVYYKSYFAADEVVAELVESFGVALSVTAEPNATNMETRCGYSAFTGFQAGVNEANASTLLRGIMSQSNTDFQNTRNAAMPVFGRAYIKTAQGYFFGGTVKRSLQEQVEAIDEIWDDLKAGQKAPLLSMAETFAVSMANWSIPNIQGIQTPGVDTEIEMPIDVVSENGIVTEEVTVSDEGIEITVPVGTQLAYGTQALTLKVTPKDETETGLVLGETQRLIPMDVHVDGLAASDSVPVLITLKQSLPVGLNDGNVQLYHVEHGNTLLMTRVDNPVNHNEFSYDPVTGNVVLAMTSFSEVSMVADTANPWDGSSATAFAGGTGTEADPFLISNAQQMAYFRDLVDSGNTFQGQYVKLSNGIDLDDVNFDPIGYGYESKKYMPDGKTFNGTFDGGEHTISGLYQNGWELGSQYSYSMAGGGLFASVVDATIKNLKIAYADITMECVDMGILVGYSQGNCTYENIGIYDSRIANYQRATGGVVGEVSPRRNADGSLMFESNKHTFKNIEVGPTVVVGSLWGDFDAPVGGVIGARWDDDDSTEVVMENVTVACRLDVYNDITAAYRWHAYRRAGMLIGNTDTPPADGRTAKVATADFLTCRNVNVYWGDWVNYNYCEFTNDNNPGRNYPWVRVQEGENCSAYSNPRYGHPLDVNGKSVTDASHTHKDGDTCHLLLPFAQLYGGGQGVYGATEHEGVSFSKPVYTVTYMNGTEVDEIIYVTDNTTAYTVKDPGEHMQWLDDEGQPVTEIPAGNTHSVVLHLDDVDMLVAHFLDINGFEVASVLFKNTDTEIQEPAVPYIEGYVGHWEKYTLPANQSIVVKPVYTIDEKYAELATDMDLNELFSYLSQGKTVVMSQELSGGQSNSGQKECAIITQTGVSGFEDKNARLNLNGYQLHYDFAANGAQQWKIFDIIDDSTLTVSGGIQHDGKLIMRLTELNKNASAVLFDLDPGAELILEKGTTIELYYPEDVKNAGSRVSMFGMGGTQFVIDPAQYPYLEYEHDTENCVKRIVVRETTVIVGVQASSLSDTAETN